MIPVVFLVEGKDLSAPLNAAAKAWIAENLETRLTLQSIPRAPKKVFDELLHTRIY